jgi:hypothetical protein
MVVLSGALRERARMGTGIDHGQLGSMRLRPGAGGRHAGPGGAPGGALQREGLPVGVVPAAARACGLAGPRLSACNEQQLNPYRRPPADGGWSVTMTLCLTAQPSCRAAVSPIWLRLKTSRQRPPVSNSGALPAAIGKGSGS